jgi:exonuclease III
MSNNNNNIPVLKFPHLTLSIQNCNSLNISTECDKQLTKIVAITSLCTSIIFLSDIRMGCTAEHSDKISKMFLTNSNKNYKFIFNSSKSSRGVGMLIDNSLAFSVLSVFKCPSENILGVRLLLDNSPIFLISIYGPNENDIAFYSQLTSLIAENSDVPVIIGGDWNSTYSTGEPNTNPDVLYMKSIPSKLRSGWLNELCIELELSDPYRALHPTRRDYTLTPRGTKKNRSRLDFFLISNNILPFVHRCEISSSL